MRVQKSNFREISDIQSHKTISQIPTILTVAKWNIQQRDPASNPKRMAVAVCILIIFNV